MSENNNYNKSGTSILTVVQIVFIVLKLIHVIKWSWWVVLIPFWIGLGFTLIYVAILLIAMRPYKIKKSKRKR